MAVWLFDGSGSAGGSRSRRRSRWGVVGLVVGLLASPLSVPEAEAKPSAVQLSQEVHNLRCTTIQPGANTGRELVEYDAQLALGQLTRNGKAKASELVNFAESQGWKRVQTRHEEEPW